MATRTERVVLELESNLTTEMARAAAATALLKRELGSLDTSAKSSTTSTKRLGDETDRLSNRAVQGSNQIDKYSGRLTVLAQVAAGLGPAFIPIAAVGIPAAVGMANALAGLGLAAGTSMLAFHNLGTAVSALDKYALDPTVTNLKAAQLALEGLPPAAREFAHEIAALQPTITGLRQAAAAGLFPGLGDALTQLGTRASDVERIFFRVGSVVGDLSRKGAEALAGPEWDDFFKFIAREAPQALVGFGHAVGDVVHGLAQLWIGFAPANHQFLDVVTQAADGFDRWASGLARTQGFQHFLDYLSTTGPLVADAVGAIANAVLQIVEAAAPLGGPILRALTAVANAIGTIAGSDAGPTIMATVTALALLSRTQAVFGSISEKSWARAISSADTYQGKIRAATPTLLKGAAVLAGVGVAASGLGDKLGIANTASLALTGTIAGPWGAAAGAAVGLFLDMTKSSNEFSINARDLTDTLNKQTGAITQNTRAYVAQQLQQQGILDAAAKIGVSLSDVTSAALGNAAATQRVREQQDAFQRSIAGSATKGLDFADAAGKVNDAIGVTSSTLRDTRGNVVQLNTAVGNTTGKFDGATSAAERFRLEIDRVNDVLTHRQDLRNYQQSLDDLAQRAADRADLLRQIGQAEKDLANATTKSARQSAKARIESLRKQADALKDSLNIDTQAGRDTQAKIDAIAQAALAVAQTMHGMAQTRFLAQARKDFIAATTDILGSKKAAEDLATRLGLVDRIHAKPKIDVQFSDAVGGIRQVGRALADLPNQKTIRINTVNNVHTGRTQLGYADGGTILGQRAPYGDKVLAALAPGEFVVSNRFGQADQHRELLRAINARRYADGGTVAASRAAPAGTTVVRGGTDIDYDRLASALGAMRPAPPLYGDVKLQPHNYSEFVRQMEQDRAMAALSGVRHG